ncbi:MAG: zinc ribbon domain-containing protein [Pontiellaceae bacterium]|nr:zinc ribbon domain-containing protein [Pontiellaceae bacterium]
MTPASAHGRSQIYHYYRCTDLATCKARIRAEEIEAAVLDSLGSINISEHEIESIISEIKKLAQKKNSQIPEESAVRKALKTANERKERITKMFIDGLITPDNAALMNKQLAAASNEANQLEGQLAAITAQNTTNPAVVQEMIAYTRSLANLKSLISMAEKDTIAQRQIINTWVKEIRRTGETWNLTLNLPGSPNCTKWLLRLDSNQRPSG